MVVASPMVTASALADGLRTPKVQQYCLRKEAKSNMHIEQRPLKALRGLVPQFADSEIHLV
eukprot:16433485-Heterocapsa_arctica.AAC.1